MLSWVMALALRLSGYWSVIFARVLSAVRFNGRKAFAILTVLFMGVSVPVFATDLSDTSGVATYKTKLFYTDSSFDYNWFDNGSWTFTLDNSEYIFYSSEARMSNLQVGTSGYIDFTFSISEAGFVDFVDNHYGTYVNFEFFKGNENNVGTRLADLTQFLNVEVYIDDVLYDTFSASDYFYATDVPVSAHIRFRVLSNSNIVQEAYSGSNVDSCIFGAIGLDAVFSSSSGSTDPSDPSDPTDPSDPSIGGSTDLNEVIDSITVVQGHLEEINGNVVEIKDSVSRIETEIIDTKEQLEDPTSPIWQAAGSAIRDAVVGVVVPSEEELQAKMDELEAVMDEKLGDVNEVIERADQLEQSISGGFTSSSEYHDFHFPGISVPLPDGVVTILPPQDVNVENKAFIVFRDMLGHIIAIICGFAGVHMMYDFAICIFSGVSYWGWVRGRHDR